MGKISLAEVARQANVSRQAMHKCAKKLEEKGYLKFIASESNQTYTSLTEKGSLYCKKSNDLKEKIEQEIAENLGEENIKLIKKLFEREWIKQNLFYEIQWIQRASLNLFNDVLCTIEY